MDTPTKPDCTAIVIFGAGGDLTWRKLVPALYSLYLDRWLPERWAIIGLDRKEMSDDQFRDHLHEGVNQFSRRGKAEGESWAEFAGRLSFMTADFGDPAAYNNLKQRLAGLNDEWQASAVHLFYQATPPAVVESIVHNLHDGGLLDDPHTSRIVLEKPFGHDLESAAALNRLLASLMAESQIYRIDHYLGKETVQNILAMRFANAMFEPVWDRRYIDNIQITVAEDIGVDGRGAYYDGAGALRDMVPNHLMQILCLVAMEPPTSFDADEVRNKKVDVLHAIRPVSMERLGEYAVRGQYAAGQIDGKPAAPYREEKGVAPNSNTETFVALKLFVDNWRWQGVPFYLRTGKRLPDRDSEATIQFQAVPHRSFPQASVADWRPNRLVVHIQPDEGIVLRFQAKRPGPQLELGPVGMRFSYREAFQAAPPEAYETLLLDAMVGDATLFMRADQVEAAWEIVTPILQAWSDTPPHDFFYPAGTWGPQESDEMMARDRRRWLPMTILDKG